MASELLLENCCDAAGLLSGPRCVYAQSIQREQLRTTWHVRTPDTFEQLLQSSDSEFLVLAISKNAAAPMLLELSKLPLPLLIETPPAVSLDELRHLLTNIPAQARIQVAEQYPLLPMMQSVTSFIQTGKLGDIQHLQVSFGHGYHVMSLIRKWLELSDAAGSVIGFRLHSSIMEGPYRGQLPVRERMVDTSQDLALLQLVDGRSALFDFTRDQYFSPIRQNRILIRGTRGEIRDDQATYMADYKTPINSALTRMQSGTGGSLEPLSLQGVLCEGNWLYRNPVHPASLSDEELAIAHVLFQMRDYVRHGAQKGYSLREACQDVYLALKMEEAIQSGNRIDFNLNRN